MALMKLFAGQQWRCRHSENRLMDPGIMEQGGDGSREREGGMNGESNV